jgi:hypothetical protein
MNKQQQQDLNIPNSQNMNIQNDIPTPNWQEELPVQERARYIQEL